MLNSTNAYQNAVYSPIRETQAKMTFTINGTSTDFYDDDIISFSILEECDSLSAALPSNELQITMNNKDGDFDFLDYANFNQIIASKPTIALWLGLVDVSVDPETFTVDYTGKVYNSTVANPHLAYTGQSFNLAAPPPQGAFWYELPTASYTNIATTNGTTATSTTSTSGNMAEMLFEFDVIQLLERRYGVGVWGDKTALADKIALAESYINSMTLNVVCRATSPTSNKVTLSTYDYAAATYTAQSNHLSGTLQNLSATIPNIKNAVTDNFGKVYFIASSDLSTTTNSVLYVDSAVLTVTINQIKALEWIPMGKYILSNWKNETGTMSVSMIGNDQLFNLSNLMYTNTLFDTYYNHVLSIFNQAGILGNIDPSLNNYYGYFPEQLDMRTALQHIAIASLSVIYQDRNGIVQIKPFTSADQTNYSNFVGTPLMISGTFWASPKFSLGNGMKYIDFDNQYAEPTVELDKSIYQLTIKIYPDLQEPYDVVYTNAALDGNNGLSMSIDNPLISSTMISDLVADWYMREMTNNILYTIDWRQNPVLECLDKILVEDSFGSMRVSRIYRNEFRYEGFLSGTTNTRGGL